MSLLHFICPGRASHTGAVEAMANRLAETPEISDLTRTEIGSIANFDVAAMAIRGFNYAS